MKSIRPSDLNIIITNSAFKECPDADDYESIAICIASYLMANGDCWFIPEFSEFCNWLPTYFSNGRNYDNSIKPTLFQVVAQYFISAEAVVQFCQSWKDQVEDNIEITHNTGCCDFPGDNHYLTSLESALDIGSLPAIPRTEYNDDGPKLIPNAALLVDIY